MYITQFEYVQIPGELQPFLLICTDLTVAKASQSLINLTDVPTANMEGGGVYDLCCRQPPGGDKAVDFIQPKVYQRQQIMKKMKEN